MLNDAGDSVLLVIDIQDRLAAAMEADDRERVVAAGRRLAHTAGLLDVPVIASRQYPRGLGEMDATLAAELPAATGVFDKTCFSCCAQPDLRARLEATGRRQVVVCGMETHVCVLQTALELAAAGFAPFVPADATCSRSADHHANALDRLRQAGVVVSNSESVLFEWLRDASHAQFKTVSKLVR